MFNVCTRAGRLACGAALLALAGTAHAATPAYDSSGSEVLTHALRDAARDSYHGRMTAAIARASDVIAQSPDFGAAYQFRARLYIATAQYAQARADIDRVFAMHPDDRTLQGTRVEISLLQGDAKAAMDEAKIINSLPPGAFWHQPFLAGAGEPGSGHHYEQTYYGAASIYAYLSLAELQLHRDDAAIADMTRMMDLEVTNAYYVLNKYCYMAAVVGQFDMAELTCSHAIELNANDYGQYDSQGYTHLRMHQWAKAVEDYNKSLAARDDYIFSLYGRGIAKHALGDKAGDDADIAAATRDEPNIAAIMQRLGVPAN